VTAIRLFTDEDVYGAIAPALRRKGFDAVSTPEANRLGLTDEEQLQWAAQEERTVVTFNVAHFAKLHGEWLAIGRHHAGIVVSNQHPLGEVLRSLVNLGGSLLAEDMRDRLEFLSNW
jgi:hypothetical protein